RPPSLPRPGGAAAGLARRAGGALRRRGGADHRELCMSLHPLRRALELLHFLVGHTWKHALLRLGLALLLFGGGALLFTWFGLAPIAASRDHFRTTQWFLGFAMRNAVETRSMGTREPPLDDPLLVRKGAGH